MSGRLFAAWFVATLTAIGAFGEMAHDLNDHSSTVYRAVTIGGMMGAIGSLVCAILTLVVEIEKGGQSADDDKSDETEAAP
jgi:hypothetical protein